MKKELILKVLKWLGICSALFYIVCYLIYLFSEVEFDSLNVYVIVTQCVVIISILKNYKMLPVIILNIYLVIHAFVLHGIDLEMIMIALPMLLETAGLLCVWRKK